MSHIFTKYFEDPNLKWVREYPYPINIHEINTPKNPTRHNMSWRGYNEEGLFLTEWLCKCWFCKTQTIKWRKYKI